MTYKAIAFVRRDFRTQASYRLDFLMRVGGMLISVSMFYFISQILGSAVNPFLQNYNADYFHFALLGIAFFPFINLSAGSLSGVIQDYQRTGTLEVLFLTPTPFPVTLIMSTLWRFCWAFTESLLYLIVASVLFRADLEWGNVLSAVVVLFFAIGANFGLGFINASFVLVTKRPSPLTRLLALVTSLLAGVYYPVEILPGWLRSFSHLLPATHAFEALRRTMLQGASLAELTQNLLALLGFAVVLLPVGLVTFRYAIRWAKIDGSLSQY